MKIKANQVSYHLGQLFSQRLELDWFHMIPFDNSTISGFQSPYYPLGASVVLTSSKHHCYIPWALIFRTLPNLLKTCTTFAILQFSQLSHKVLKIIVRDSKISSASPTSFPVSFTGCYQYEYLYLPKCCLISTFASSSWFFPHYWN